MREREKERERERERERELDGRTSLIGVVPLGACFCPHVHFCTSLLGSLLNEIISIIIE